jgi:hypothetical protein
MIIAAVLVSLCLLVAGTAACGSSSDSGAPYGVETRQGLARFVGAWQSGSDGRRVDYLIMLSKDRHFTVEELSASGTSLSTRPATGRGRDMLIVGATGKEPELRFTLVSPGRARLRVAPPAGTAKPYSLHQYSYGSWSDGPTGVTL